MHPETGVVLTLPRRRVLGALIRRDFLIARSYRAAFLLDLFFGIMNLLIFFFISRVVALRSGSLQGARTYFAFAAVGIILTVVTQAATAGLARRVREEQLTGTLEILAVQPISTTELNFGLTGFPFAFATVRASLYIVFAATALHLDLSHADLLGAGVILVAAGASLAAIGVLMGAAVLILKQGETLSAVVTFGFTLVSGALFPRVLLPGWLQGIGTILPTRLALDGMRSALFLGDGWGGDLVGLTVLTLVLMPFSIAVFGYTLALVKRRGSLSQY